MPSSPHPSGPKDKRPSVARPTALWWVLGALFLLAIGQAYFMTPGGRTISYSEFKALVRSGQVAEVSVGDTHIRGVLKNAGESGTNTFSTTRIEDPKLVEELDQASVKYSGDRKSVV